MSSTTPDPQNPGPQYGQAPQYNQAPQHNQTPQYGEPGSRFGTQPYGAAPQQFGGPVAEPKKFRTLLTLTLASAGLYALSGLISLFMDRTETTRQMLQEQGRTGAELEQAVQASSTFGLIVGVVALVVVLGLYALVYVGLRSVKNWARITGIVFAIISVVMTLLSLLGAGLLAGLGLTIIDLGSPLGILSAVLSVVALVVNILWLVNAFNKDVAAYTKQGRVTV
ncbi:DUF6264 family protein [Micrococcus sp.]|uniref:DUF6264 family protein n=1 Tax=Micrococcus sp. TaxID=1271 RepID=UPI0039C69540